MIPIPESIKKFFEIVDDNTLIFRPSISKWLIQCTFVFGLPTLSWFIGFDYWIFYGFGIKDILGVFVCLAITTFCFLHGYFLALPSLRKRITFDIKNRIIRTEYGRHREIKDTFSFDEIDFIVKSEDGFSIPGECYSSKDRLYFIDIKTGEPRHELALGGYGGCVDMCDFLEELCAPDNTFEVKS
jgi:hypothetical protein